MPHKRNPIGSENVTGLARVIYYYRLGSAGLGALNTPLYTGFSLEAGNAWATRGDITGTSLIFAATHANLMTFIPLVLLSLALIWLYEQTDNLLAPILAHSLFNAVNFFFLVAGQSLPAPIGRGA